MAYYRVLGDIPRKRHSRFRDAGGALYHEELIGEEGFSSDSALLYHRFPPSAIIDAESVDETDIRLVDNVPLLPRHLRCHGLSESNDLVTGRRLLLGNDAVRISYVVADGRSGLYRDAVGDQLVFLESGSARLDSVFGTLTAREGDYVLIPASTTHRWIPVSPVRALVIESIGHHIGPPARYLSPNGQFLELAPYSERDIRGPDALLNGAGEFEVLVRHRGGRTRYRYQNDPFDVVGWDGCCYPYALSIHDFEPIVKRFHAPPPVHQTFQGSGFVVCSFCPRPFDFDPEAVPVPYSHANVDCDEVLFYVDGDFMSRKGAGIAVGSITLHPAGFVHGPQPGSVEQALDKQATNELAVMIDTFAPLRLAEDASSVEDRDYAWSWSGAVRHPRQA